MKSAHLWLVVFLFASVMEGQSPSSRSLSVIAVPDEKEALDLRARLESGDSFEALATLHSTDPTSVVGGYLGTKMPVGLNTESYVELSRMRPGEISPVIAAGDRFFIMKRSTPDEDLWRSRDAAGLKALQQGHYAEATELFLEGVRLWDANTGNRMHLARSLNQLARAYLYQQKHREAAEAARRSLEILEDALGPRHPGLGEGLALLASSAQSGGNGVEAEQTYRRLIQVRWGDPVAIDGVSVVDVLEKFAAVLTFAYTQDPRLDEALRRYRTSVAAASFDRNLYGVMRDGLLSVRLVSEAESLMKNAVRKYPESRQLLFQLGELLEKAERYQGALDAFERAAETAAHPDVAVDDKQRSRIYEKIGEMDSFLVRLDDAFSAFKKALKLDPASAGAQLALGDLYVQRNMPDRALAEYAQVVHVDSRNVAAHYGLAQANLALGKADEAAQEAARALEIDPRQQQSRYVLAMALIRGGHVDEGRHVLKEYDRADLEQNERESRQQAILEIERSAAAWLADKNLSEAAVLLQESLREYPEAAILYLKLGLVQGRLGNHEAAARTFQTMARLGLADFLTHRSLSLEFEALGDDNEALRERATYLQHYDAALQARLN